MKTNEATETRSEAIRDRARSAASQSTSRSLIVCSRNFVLGAQKIDKQTFSLPLPYLDKSGQAKLAISIIVTDRTVAITRPASSPSYKSQQPVRRYSGVFRFETRFVLSSTNNRTLFCCDEGSDNKRRFRFSYL